MEKKYSAPDIIIKETKINSCMLQASVPVTKTSASSTYNGGDGGNNDAKTFATFKDDYEW